MNQERKEERKQNIMEFWKRVLFHNLSIKLLSVVGAVFGVCHVIVDLVHCIRRGYGQLHKQEYRNRNGYRFYLVIFLVSEFYNL